ncbi:uncharacterized protein FOMMEDRAFT_72998 [Fomitiporia mediterranea MF3/22]|uniref:uncharacterized protein n=1 Tax=Fomitiporia mediterranea (strain MF3/22) TaxID=694068 RepID=UPI0004408429|nr:uncharacterized protein FOMMEDRAFT_72998 [Fomitiporia mediterranea MF3/22]EJD07391.1 hypothetical protein FOMMEDRAFT_72998 [Fomitiporia mediterranea MF3/22]
MSNPSGSGSGQNGSTPKAIANTARRQDDVTRRGTSKMKFTPTLPPRRKKECVVELVPPLLKPIPTSDTRGRGRGAVRGRGRGDARGGAPHAASEMTATGPLALGPTMAGSSAARRAAPRSNFAPVAPLGTTPSSSLGTGLTHQPTPSLKREPSDLNQKVIDVDTYSDPDEGVEIIDIDDVRRMDWMAPESLRKEKVRQKKRKPGEVTLEEDEDEHVDLANALDLSESEEEEEMEDLINDFTFQEEDLDADPNVRAEKLYFFQFPEPFPTFLLREPPKSEDVEMTETAPSQAVTFAPDVKPPASGASTPVADGSKKEEAPVVPLDGVIGQLEIHQSGAVKMRLENGILLDVSAATQPSFLQHAVRVDMEKKRLSVIGEVNRRFVVTPNIDALLASLERADRQAAMEVDKVEIEEGLVKLETEAEKEKSKQAKTKKK